MNAPAPASTAAPSTRRHIPELAVDWLLDTPERRWQVLDGTLCFADISGFTALAERLARRGRMGGEELISRLGGVFSDMLDLARARGGMLLKFGGDALLLFFQGPDHALQAASAAVAMRQVLRDAAATPTSVGPLRLSMSVGLHSGPAHFFLVGSKHRELVLLGPGADGVVATESAANAGEIGLSPTTGALLPPRASKPRPDGLPLLRWRKPAVPPCGARPERAAPEAVLRTLFPGVLCEFLGAAVPEPEHRVACIAFIRFSGTDALLAREGPDAVARVLDATLGPIQECLDAEAITLLALDVDKDGGKLFLGSGVPYAHDDDEGNMLRALRRIADLDLPLDLQMGVNRGHVFAAEVGSAKRAAYSAMGDTTNTAARITAKAPVGAIYAHPSVLDESLAVFEVTPSPPLTMKGKKAPLVVYRIGPQTGTRRREGLTVAEFLGRAPELATLTNAIAAVVDGSGGVLAVTGDTGMGKSKLIREALARAGQTPLLALRGEPNAESSAFALLRAPLARALGLSDLPASARAPALTEIMDESIPDLAELAPLIGEVVGIPLPPTPETGAIDPQFRAARTADVLLGLLAARFPGPRIWVIDDAQWCDESSATLLTALATACSTHPWLLLTARRPGAGGFDPATSEPAQSVRPVNLGPMEPGDLADLLNLASEAAPLRPHEFDAVVSRAGGNPLFALELLRAAREAGSFDAVPESLEAAMAAQVDALDPDARRLLRYASVLGRSFPRAVLLETLSAEGQPVDDATLERLEDFLEPEPPDRLRFRSDVICDTTYQAVSYQLRRRLHQRVGATMERLAADPATIADTLALHFARADDHPRTWHYAYLAAERARERYANAEAARFFQLALQAARHVASIPDATRIELLKRLGEVTERAGLLEDSFDAYRLALSLVGADHCARAELLYARGAAKDRMRSFTAAIRDFRTALRLIEGDGSRPAAAIRSRLLAGIAWVMLGQDRPGAALRQAQQAADHARGAGEEASLASALMAIELAQEMLEGPGPGDRLKEALGIFERLGEQRKQAVVEANLGFLCAVAGRLQEGVHWLNAAKDRFHRIGDVVTGADPSLNLGEMLVKQRRYDAAEPVLRDAIRVLNAVHFEEAANRGELQLARILIERGALDDAEAVLARVQQSFGDAGQRLSALEVACTRAFGRLRAGEPQRALALLDDARSDAGPEADRLLAQVACERARILAAQGHLSGAEDEIATGLAAAREQHLPYEEAMLLELKAEIGASAGRMPEAAETETLQRLQESLGLA